MVYSLWFIGKISSFAAFPRPYTIHHSLTYLRLKVGFEGDYSGYMKKMLYLCSRIRI